MADKGVTIPVNLVVDEQGFAERLVQATSKSGKKMEKNLNQALVSAFNVEAAYKQAKQALAEIGKLPVDPSTGKQLSEKDFAALEKSAKKATAYIEAYNKMQEEANKMQMVTSKKGLTPVLTEKAQDITKPIEQYENRLKDIKAEIAEIVSMQKDIDLYEENKSILTDRSQMVDMEVDIIDKYERQQKILESSIKAQETIKQQIRDYNAELEKAHHKEIPNATNMKKWGARSILDDPKLKSFETRAANAQARMNEMEEAYKKAKQLIDLRDRLAEKGFIDEESGQAVQNLDQWFSQSVQDIAQLNNETNNLNSAIHEINAELSNMPVEDKYKLIGVSDEDVNKVNDLAAAFSATANSAQDAVDFMEYGITATQKAADEKQKEKERAAALKQQIKEAKEAEKQAAEQSRAWRKAVDNVKGSFTRILGTLRKVLTGLRQFGRQSKTSFNEGQPPLKKMFNLVLRFGFGIRSIFFLVKRLKKTIVDDFNVMAQSIPEVNKQLSELSTSWLKLKATLGTLAQPLLQFFGPIINWAINKVQELMTVWAKFIALLTGQKYIYTAETAMVDYAKSLGDAAGAAKELNKQLAPFDKLNVLNSNDKGGGGGGGKPTEINTDNVKYLKEDLEDIDNIFYEMGKRSAQMFNDIMNSFDWEKIKEKAKEYAKDITDYIWGWVDTFDFAKFGQTLAEGINTIFTFIKTFVETMPWSEIGEGIGTSITNFFDTLDIETISDGIAGAINGAVNLVAGLLKETDFKKIGTKIGEFLSKTFKKINWKKLGSTLKDLIVGLATVVVNTMKAIDWEEVGHGISDCLEELFDGDPNPLVAVGEALWTCLQSAIELKHAMFDGHPIANFVTDALILLFTVGPIVGRLMNIGTAIMGLIGTGMTTAAATTAVTTAASTAAASATTAAAAGATTAATAAGSAAGGAMVLGMAAGVAAAAAGGATLGYVFDKYVLDTHGIGIDNWYQKAQDESKAAAQEWAEETQADAIEYWNTGLLAAADELEGFDTLLSIGEGLSETGGINEEWTETIDDIEKGLRKIAAAGVDLGDTEAVLEFIADPFNNVGFGQYSNAAKYVEMISEQWDGLSISAQAALLNLDPDKYTEVLNEIAGEYSSTADSIEESNNSIFDNIASVFEALTSTADEQIGALSTIFGDLKSSLTDVFNGIIGGSEAMSNGVTDGLNQVSDSLNSMSFTLPDWLPGVGGKSLNFNLPRLGKVSIPRLAQGGVIPANNEFLAVLGDQKQGTNIEAPLDTIKQAFAEVITQMNTNSSKDGDIIINIDGEEVFRVVRDQDRIFKKSTGKSAFA